MHIRTIPLSTVCPLVLLFIISASGKAQDDTISTPVSMMFYNVENLFDTSDDPLRNDNEFLPDGVRRWNKSRYLKKINYIAKTIMAAGGWSPPAIVAFCEVENKEVLEDLVYGTNLSKFSYGIIHVESPDERGIDVCMIYRKDLVRVIDHRSWIPSSVAGKDFRTRSVLYVKCAVMGDSVHLIVNHWPSRRGGVLAGESRRMEIAAMVRNAADSLAAERPGRSKIIILGDFNCNPEDDVIQQITATEADSSKTGNGGFINLASRNNSGNKGTYNYQGVWETIDQVIVSESLTRCAGGLSTDWKGFRIFSPDFLLMNDPRYPGYTPFSTYRGYRYQGGFSDHLPVLLDLVFIRSAGRE